MDDDDARTALQLLVEAYQTSQHERFHIDRRRWMPLGMVAAVCCKPSEQQAVHVPVSRGYVVDGRQPVRHGSIADVLCMLAESAAAHLSTFMDAPTPTHWLPVMEVLEGSRRGAAEAFGEGVWGLPWRDFVSACLRLGLLDERDTVAFVRHCSKLGMLMSCSAGDSPQVAVCMSPGSVPSHTTRLVDPIPGLVVTSGHVSTSRSAEVSIRVFWRDQNSG